MRVKEIDGIPVIDAKRPFTLTVTKRDCANADPKEPSSCALARACRRELHVAEARVHLSRIYLRMRDGKHWRRYSTPKELRMEIVVFDRGGDFRPGVYRIPIVKPSARLGADKRKRQDNRARHDKGKKRHYTKLTDVRGGPA